MQPFRRALLGVVTLLLSTHVGSPIAATLPAGFVEVLVAGGLTFPTAMDIAPDGRVFVCEQAGALRVIKNGALLAQPFVTLPVTSSGERGLLGIAFDPEFAVNGFVYVYYTTTSARNRVSRFTANGDVAQPGSETLIFEIDGAAPGNHNGGAIHFGPDGRLYVAVGDYSNAANSQSMSSQAGKILRINADGSIPGDNPFFASTTGNNRAIWALGLRNPFTFGFHRTSGRMFINDVGSSAFEEINDGIVASNYGWPATEGPTSDSRFRSPLYAYPRTSSSCAILGGAFYTPVAHQFPPEFAGDYFFSDWCSGLIRRYTPSTGAVTPFASAAAQMVDLKVGLDGSLYYLLWGAGAVYRIDYPSRAERLTIGLGSFGSDAGRFSVHSGHAGSYANTAALQVPWPAYTSTGGGVHVAAGDVDGDGLSELVVGLSSGGAGWMAIFDDASHGHSLMRWVQVPWPNYNHANGAVFPAVGNLDGDAAHEIVAGLGSDSNGWFAIMDDANNSFGLVAWRRLAWESYSTTNGTTHPAVGDVDGDGQREIVLGLGSGGGGWLAVIEGGASGYSHRMWIRVHWPDYNASTGGATWPAVGDFDGDGRGEIAVGLGPGGGGWIEIVDDSVMSFANVTWLRLSWSTYNASVGETHPAAGNLDGDAAAELAIGTAAFAPEGGWVEIFDDAASGYARRGWQNAQNAAARQAGAASYPAIGAMR